MAVRKKPGENRYSGQDQNGYIVKNTEGEAVSGSVTSYAEAAHLASTYTESTGNYAAPVRQ